MAYLFYECNSLTSLNLSNFYTSNVKDMSGMFEGCNSLNFIDMSNFDFSNCNSYSNMFSSNNNLKFVNLYNINDNNNILSNIFNEVSNLYICIKSNNIINPNIYNCCDYNHESNECNFKTIEAVPLNIYSPAYTTVITQDLLIPNSPDSPIINTPESSSGNTSDSTTTGTSNNNNNNNNKDINNNNNQFSSSSYSSKSSSSFSIGIIISIIAGVVVLIGIVIAIFFICRRMKKNKEKKNKSKEDSINNENSQDIIIPRNQIIVKLVTNGQYKIQLTIETEKKMSDLIKAYFAEIKKPNLFGDPSIRFLFNAKIIEHNSNDLVKNYIKKDANTIVIDDLEDKIYSLN